MAVVIADLLPEPVKIEVGRGTLTAHGLPLEEIVPLIMNHKDELLPFFSGDKPDLQGLITEAPKIAAELIAVGVNAVGQEDDIRRMPAATQIECLLAIWSQSVPDIKKLRESLLTVVASISLDPKEATKNLTATPTSDSLPPPLTTSSGKGTGSAKSKSTPSAK
jgi:hypothetical protein